MTLRLSRVASRAMVASLLVALNAGCAGAASGSPSPSAGRSPLTQAAAKEALLARLGPLVYCDPDYYPVARADEASAATEHLAEMRADTAAWAAIAAHLGFDPSSTPSGDGLLAAYREWKMLRGLALTTSGDGWGFDARFGGTGPDASASPSVTHVVAAPRLVEILQQPVSGQHDRLVAPLGRSVRAAQFGPLSTAGLRAPGPTCLSPTSRS
jgi:hypothetical protein